MFPALALLRPYYKWGQSGVGGGEDVCWICFLHWLCGKLFLSLIRSGVRVGGDGGEAVSRICFLL